MTSRVSYFKMVTSGMKRRIWYGATAFFVFFCAFPLMAMMRFQSVKEVTECIQDVSEREYQLNMLKEEFQLFLGGGDLFLMFLIAGIALLGAWSGLSWLHSRRKMDMMGSLPVRREKIFLTESMVIYLLAGSAYVINMILALAVGASKGIVTGETAAASLAGLGIYLIYFVMFYFCGTLAMLLTGKILTGILGTGVFMVIAPVIYGVLQAYLHLFFKTYVSGEGTGMNQVITWLSPAGNYLNFTAVMGRYWDGMTEAIAFPWITLVAAVVMGIVFAGFSFWLMKVRKAESAEKSMAFVKTEGVIKGIILYPLILGGGLFFVALSSINGQGNDNWIWFGLLFTAVVGGILIEIIYYFDRKQIFGHKIWTGISFGAAALTAVFFAFDITGYDKWLPKEEEIAHAAMYDNSGYSWWDYSDGSHTAAGYIQNNLEQFQGKGVLELAREGVENLDRDSWEENYTSVEVYFQLKNGKVVKRGYTVSDQLYRKTEREMFEEKAYREVEIPIMYADDSKIQIQGIRHWNQNISLDELSNKEKRELIRNYQEDLRGLSFDEIYEKNSSLIEFSDENYNYIPEYTLNRNFTKTVKYLKEKGIDVVSPLDLDSVVQVAFRDFREDEYLTEADSEVCDKELLGEDRVTQDKEFIKKALGNMENLVLRDNLYRNKINTEDLCMELEVSIDYKTKEGVEVSSMWYYQKDTVPEEVEQFLSK